MESVVKLIEYYIKDKQLGKAEIFIEQEVNELGKSLCNIVKLLIELKDINEQLIQRLEKILFNP